MSGTAIIGALLRGNAALLGEVAEANIKGGRLPDAAPLPSLVTRTVSEVERTPLRTGAMVRVVERVSVLVRAGSYRDQKRIVGLVKRACRGTTGTIAGIERVAILPAGAGPDLNGPNDSFQQAIDFRVSFDAMK